MSGEIVVIAEKPELAQAIAQGLGGGARRDGYIDCGQHYVTWAIGHMLKLVDPEGPWGPFSELPISFIPWSKRPVARTSGQLAVIRELLLKARSVIHAGDPDEEGQLIVDEILDFYDCKLPTQRILVNDNNLKSVQKALASLKDNDDFRGMSEAADARSIGDLIYGVNMTRAYTLAARQKGADMLLSVGRVQTPILGLVVRRDREFEAHKVAYYYNVVGQFDVSGLAFPAKYQPGPQDPVDDKGRISDQAFAQGVAAAVKGKPARIVDAKTTSKEAAPPLPYNLLKLQADAARKFNLKPDKVLNITQSLREQHKLITYNRSDSQYLNDDQHENGAAVLEAIGKTAPGLAGPAGRADPKVKSRAFNSAKVSAHHAIIPTEATADMAQLTEDERKIYMLIARSYIAQFWPNHRYDQTDITVECEGRTFKCRANVTTSEGWRVLYKNDEGNEETAGNDEDIESDLRAARTGQSGRCASCSSEKKETKPTPLYTIATLLTDLTRVSKYVKDDRLRKLLIEKDKDKAGEHGGIGTPATRDKIVKLLYDRGFLADKGKNVVSTPQGRAFYDSLPDQAKFPDMTALWHEQQKEISAKRKTKLSFVEGITKYVADQVANIAQNGLDIVSTAPKCPRCTKPLRRLKGSKGIFWSCTGRDDGCKFTADDKNGKPNLTKAQPAAVSSEHKCGTCGKGLVRRPSAKKKGEFWWSCSGYPDCKQTYFDKDGKPNMAPRPQK